ncbi:EMBRYO DEFECTIVE 2737 [Salix purpurea]|uniref:EMBRYO DEFECTIVE 2737 n=1 Tax=Salix purpurea TaxID=77065 RepID=A0A9Q0WNX5_SALPP|nr:EMBRYO DEFECTIVE 2737 [Salix purpurea]
MSRGTGRLIKSVKQFADLQYKLFTARYGQQLIDIFEFPIELVLSPFTLAFDIVGSAPRGFGVPELVSKLSYASIFV